MGRTKNQCYHFKLIDYTNPEKPITKLYRTIQDVCDYYKCYQRSIYYKIRNPNSKSKYFKNVEIFKVKIPIQILVKNPDLDNIINSLEINDEQLINNQIDRNKLSNEEFNTKLNKTN